MIYTEKYADVPDSNRVFVLAQDFHCKNPLIFGS